MINGLTKWPVFASYLEGFSCSCAVVRRSNFQSRLPLVCEARFHCRALKSDLTPFRRLHGRRLLVRRDPSWQLKNEEENERAKKKFSKSIKDLQSNCFLEGRKLLRTFGVTSNFTPIAVIIRIFNLIFFYFGTF